MTLRDGNITCQQPVFALWLARYTTSTVGREVLGGGLYEMYTYLGQEGDEVHDGEDEGAQDVQPSPAPDVRCRHNEKCSNARPESCRGENPSGQRSFVGMEVVDEGADSRREHGSEAALREKGVSHRTTKEEAEQKITTHALAVPDPKVRTRIWEYFHAPDLCKC